MSGVVARGEPLERFTLIGKIEKFFYCLNALWTVAAGWTVEPLNTEA
jgi:hypothetical protein